MSTLQEEYGPGTVTPNEDPEEEKALKKKISLFEQKWEKMQTDVEKVPKPTTTRKFVRGTEPMKTDGFHTQTSNTL